MLRSGQVSVLVRVRKVLKLVDLRCYGYINNHIYRKDVDPTFFLKMSVVLDNKKKKKRAKQKVS